MVAASYALLSFCNFGVESAKFVILAFLGGFLILREEEFTKKTK